MYPLLRFILDRPVSRGVFNIMQMCLRSATHFCALDLLGIEKCGDTVKSLCALPYAAEASRLEAKQPIRAPINAMGQG